MRPLTPAALKTLLTWHGPPCVSLYMPTHRHSPDNLQDPIRFKNLVRELERSLADQYPARDVRELLAAAHRLQDDYRFWTRQLDGLAVLAAPGLVEVFELPRRVPERAIAAGSFHLKPLLRYAQSADRFHVLALDRAKARLYEGTRDAIDEVDLPDDFPDTIGKALGEELTDPHTTVAAYAGGSRARLPGGAHGEPAARHGHGGKGDELDTDVPRFFRAVDRAVAGRFSAPTGFPLLLAALPEYHAEFRAVSHNPHLLPVGVGKHPNGFATPDHLRAAAWEVVRPAYEGRLARLGEDFRTARGRGLAADRAEEVAAAVTWSRVGTLLVDADRLVPGRFDAAAGTVAAARLRNPEVDDVLDDLAEEVLRRGGEVVVVPAVAMPTATGLAATFRF